MDPYELCIQMAYLELGLIPPGMNVGSALSELSPEDARKAKRKFRKMHRKSRKNARTRVLSKKTRRGYAELGYRGTNVPRRKDRENSVAALIIEIEQNYGKPNRPPSTLQKLRRQRAVNNMLTVEVLK